MTTENPTSTGPLEPELVIQTDRGVRRVKPVSQQSVWDKITRYASRAGRGVCEKVLWLWYTAQSPTTPKWAKRTAYGALAYFILPFDSVPDFLPVVGFSDDLTALTAALGIIAVYVTDEVKDQASETLKRWFG